MRIGPRIGLAIGVSIGGEPSGVAAVPTWLLTKTGGVGGNWDAEARTAVIYAGTVSVEFSVASPIISSEFTIGLSADNPDTDYTSIDFSLAIASGAMFVIENNGAFVNLGAPILSDVWRVTRTMPSGAVTYYKNGVLVHTSVGTSVATLLVDSSFRFASNAADNVSVSTAAGAQLITWTLTNITASEE